MFYRILFILVLCLSPAAWAGNGYYFGIGVAQNQYQLNDANIQRLFALAPASTLRDSAPALNLWAGYQFDPYLAMEFELNVVDSITVEQNGVKTNLFTPSGFTTRAVLGRDLGQRLRVFAGLGVYFWDISETNSDASLDDGMGLTANLGLDINLFGGRERLMRLQWSRQDYDSVYFNSSDIFSIAVIFSRVR